jgi:hypothetical protein
VDSTDELRAAVDRELGISPRGKERPEAALIERAAEDIPALLDKMDPHPYLPVSVSGPPPRVVVARHLLSRLAGRGHGALAAAWAVRLMALKGLLQTEFAELWLPSSSATRATGQGKTRSDNPGRVPRIVERPQLFEVPAPTVPGPVWALPARGWRNRHPGLPPQPPRILRYLIVWATDLLWPWWHGGNHLVSSIASDSRRAWELRPGLATYKGTEIRLSGLPWRLLRGFVQSRGHVLNREDILRLVWGSQVVSDTRVRGLLVQLRSKLRAALQLAREQDPIERVDTETWKLTLS